MRFSSSPPAGYADPSQEIGPAFCGRKWWSMLAFEPSLISRLWHAVQNRLGLFRLNDLTRPRHVPAKRRFHRHSLAGFDAIQLSLKGQIYRVLNLSYGGLRLQQAEGAQALGRTGTLCEGELVMFGLAYPLRFSLQHVDQETVGLAFHEISVHEEQFLSGFLYFLDAGFVLKSAPKSAVANQFRGPDWHSYAGLRGAVEVHLHIQGNQPVREAHVYYLNGMRQDFAIFTEHSVMIACSPKRELSSREKQEILIHVICILMGLKQVGKTDRLDVLISLALQRLQKAQKHHSLPQSS